MGRHWIRDPSLEKVTGLGLLVCLRTFRWQRREAP